MQHHPALLSTAEYLTGEEREWIINCILPATGLTLLTAPPGAGKTKLALAMAGKIAMGEPFFDQYTKKGKIAYFNLDRMYKGDIEARLQDLDPDGNLPSWADQITWIEDDVNILGTLTGSDEHGNTFAIKKDDGSEVKIIDYLIDHLKGYSMIVIDTWHKLCVNAGMQENEADDTDTLMMPLRKLANATDAGIFILHHTSKSDPYHGRGSIAIEGTVDHVLNLTGRADGELILNYGKTRTDKINIYPIEINETYTLNIVDPDTVGKPIGAWKCIISQERKILGEEERKAIAAQNKLTKMVKKFGEHVSVGKYGMHRNSLMESIYKGKKTQLDQVIDNLRKHGRLETTSKGANPFYVISI